MYVQRNNSHKRPSIDFEGKRPRMLSKEISERKREREKESERENVCVCVSEREEKKRSDFSREIRSEEERARRKEER